MKWRWYQGRLAYFRFENICSMAKVLRSLDGIDLGTKEDFLRQPLEKNTGLPFAPTHYKVWRNYSRVFQCAMLATSFERRLIATELCNNLSGNNPFSPDEYLNFVFLVSNIPIRPSRGTIRMPDRSFPLSRF